MINLLYVSSAVHEMDEPELLALLEQARARNASRGITGMLLYAGGNFMQLLEGEREAVHEVYREIEKDERHHQQIVILDEEIEQRSFPDWSMGFRYLNKDDTEIEGYTKFLYGGQDSAALSDSGIVLELLQQFSDTTR